MPEPRPQSWLHQPDIATLEPDSYTAQRLVQFPPNCQEDRALTMAATLDPRAPAHHIETLLHRAYSGTVHARSIARRRRRLIQDTGRMAEDASPRLVQAPSAHQLLDPHQHLHLDRPPRLAPTTPDGARWAQRLRPLPAQLPAARRARDRGGAGTAAWADEWDSGSEIDRFSTSAPGPSRIGAEGASRVAR